MKLIKTMTLAIILMAAGTQQASAQYVMVPKAYMFGFVASFNDSTVYFTNIQEVENVWVTKKKKLLGSHSSYTYQLREFFNRERNLPNRTCIVSYALKRKDIEKKYAKMKKQYLGKNKKVKVTYDVRYIPDTDFQFKSVEVE